MFLAYWLKPLIAGIFLNILVICKVLHPTVLGSTVPMLYAFGNFNYHAGFQFDGWLSPFLVPSATAHAYQHLNLVVMNMPVVAASNSQF